MRLELNESFGTTTTLQFNNKILKTGHDYEQRIIPWEKPLLSFNISKTILNQAELDYLISFFQITKGQSGYFRFKDYTDYSVTKTDFYTDLGITTRGIVAPKPDGLNKKFQIVKVYYLQDTQSACFRPITRIDERTPVTVSINGTLVNDFSVNHNTGVITFVDAPANQSDIGVDCEFEIWCRFEQDNLDYKILTGENNDTLLYGVDSLKITESREDFLATFTSHYLKHHEHLLALSFKLDQSGGETFQTKVITLSSGFSKGDYTRTFPLREFKTGERYLGEKDIGYMIGLFRLLRGNGSTFKIDNTDAHYRFSQEMSIIAETVDINRDAYVYLCQSLELKEVNEIDSHLEILGQNAIVTSTSFFKDNIYWGFSAANGAVTSQVEVFNPLFNGVALAPNFVLVGTAENITGNDFRIVEFTGNTEGAVWSSPIPEQQVSNFSVFFQFSLSNPVADGLAFVLQSQSQVALQAFTEGGGIGYMGVAPSIAVEFDGYRNSWDSSGNRHCGISINGNVDSSTWRDTDSVLSSFSGFCWIDYDGTEIRVYLSQSDTKPSEVFLSHSIAVTDIFQKIESTTVKYEQGTISEVGMGIYTIAHCWKIERKDGVTITLTNHDKTLHINGLAYSPLAAPESTSLSFSAALNVDNTEMTSLLVSEFINESDILGGKYDYAVTTIFIYDYVSNTMIKTLVSGYIGEVTTTNRTYTAEVRGYAQHLQKKHFKMTTKTCPLIFGEQGLNKCNKDLTGLFETMTITEVSGQQKFKISSVAANEVYTSGVIEWIAGQNLGIRLDVALHRDQEITLWESMPYPIEVGDSIRITSGCLKTVDACISYNNLDNFGGDPFLPGNNYYLAGVLNIK